MKALINILIFVLVSLNLFAASSFSEDRLREACLAFIKSRHKTNVKVDFLNKFNDQRFSQDGVEASFQVKGAELGHTSILIIFKNSDQIVKTLDVPVKIRSYQRIPVLINNKSTGETISANDLAYVEMLTDGDEIVDPTLLIGSELKRPVKKGAAVKIGQIKESKIVSKGDLVKLKIYSGKILISSMGKALNDATNGEVVRVQRDGSQGVIQGVAYPDGSVIVRN